VLELALSRPAQRALPGPLLSWCWDCSCTSAHLTDDAAGLARCVVLRIALGCICLSHEAKTSEDCHPRSQDPQDNPRPPTTPAHSHNSRSVPPLPLSGPSHETHYIQKTSPPSSSGSVLRTTLGLKTWVLVSGPAAVLPKLSRHKRASLFSCRPTILMTPAGRPP
jgi:hypothetical protein